MSVDGDQSTKMFEQCFCSGGVRVGNGDGELLAADASQRRGCWECVTPAVGYFAQQVVTGKVSMRVDEQFEAV